MKTMFLYLSFLLASGFFHNFAVCDVIDSTSTESPGSKTTPTQNLTTLTVPLPTPVSTNPELTANVVRNGMSLFTSGVNKLIFSSNEKDTPAPVIWSPLSIYLTLRALYPGAVGSTLEELKNVMGIKNDNELSANSTQVSPNSLLKSVTMLFPADDTSVNPSYEEKIVSFSNKDTGMSTKIQPINFKQSVFKAAQTINDIIKEKTDEQITNIVDPSVLSAATKLIIANAVEFTGKWRNQFDPKWTKSETFHGLKNSNTVKLMRQKGTFESGEIKELNATILQLEYDNSSFVCQFLLPDTGTSVKSVWGAINEKGVLDRLQDHMQPKEMEIFIPRMRMESDVPVQDALTKLGLATLFTPQANLSQMLLPTKNGPNEVYVSKMMHKAVFKMDEEGTKAAAATAGVLIPLSNFNSQPEVFRVDRPYVIILKDAITNVIAFMGCVTELTPEETEFSDSNRANFAPSTENQNKDSSTKEPKSTDQGTDSKQSTITASTTEEEWWKHTGVPEYITTEQTESSDLPADVSVKFVTPQFQQPEPANPAAIRFPYPHRAEYKLVNNASKKSKEKIKQQSG